jgi:hypothetical protein
MTVGRVGYVEREHRRLVRLDTSSRRDRRSRWPAAGSLGYVSYFAELIDEWAQDNDPNEPLFRSARGHRGAGGTGQNVQTPRNRWPGISNWLLRLQGVYEDERRMSGRGEGLSRAQRASSPFAIGDVKVSQRALSEVEGAHRGLIAMHLEKDEICACAEMRR